MKNTKFKDFKNMAFIPCCLLFPPKIHPFFYAFSFTVKKLADFCQKLLLHRSMCYPKYEYIVSEFTFEQS